MSIHHQVEIEPSRGQLPVFLVEYVFLLSFGNGMCNKKPAEAKKTLEKNSACSYTHT
ncbi:hypothetical protein ACU8KH_00674 [Lachancea thermotolerans]